MFRRCQEKKSDRFHIFFLPKTEAMNQPVNPGNKPKAVTQRQKIAKAIANGGGGYGTKRKTSTKRISENETFDNAYPDLKMKW